MTESSFSRVNMNAISYLSYYFVGHIDGGGFEALVHQFHFGTHLDPQLGVEVGQRLVEQVDLGPTRQPWPHRP